MTTRHRPRGMKRLTLEYLNDIKPGYIQKGYPIPKWIQFAEQMLEDGWIVDLYTSKSTVSKYLYILKDNQDYKIRFSNHKASKDREEKGDSDFYVGVGNNGVITTEQLVKQLINN